MKAQICASSPRQRKQFQTPFNACAAALFRQSPEIWYPSAWKHMHTLYTKGIGKKKRRPRFYASATSPSYARSTIRPPMPGIVRSWESFSISPPPSLFACSR